MHPLKSAFLSNAVCDPDLWPFDLKI